MKGQRPPPYRPRDWYWVVGGDDARLYSSARKGYVPRPKSLPDNLSKVATEEELWEVLERVDPELLPPAAQDYGKARALKRIDQSVLAKLLDHENRLRRMEGKAVTTVNRLFDDAREPLVGEGV